MKRKNNHSERESFFEGSLNEQQEKKIKNELLSEESAEGDMYRAVAEFGQLEYPRGKRKLPDLIMSIAAALALLIASIIIFNGGDSRVIDMDKWQTSTSFRKLEMLDQIRYSGLEVDNEMLLYLTAREENINVKISLLQLVQPGSGNETIINEMIKKEESPVVKASLSSLITVSTNNNEEIHEPY